MSDYVNEHLKLQKNIKLQDKLFEQKCQQIFNDQEGLVDYINHFTQYAVALGTRRHTGSGCWLTHDILLTNAHVIPDLLALDTLCSEDQYLAKQIESGYYFRRPSTLGYYPDQFLGKVTSAGPSEGLRLEFEDHHKISGSYLFYIDPYQETLTSKIHFVKPIDDTHDLLKLKLEPGYHKENGQSGSPLFEAKLLITGSNTYKWQIRLLGLVFGYDMENDHILAFRLKKEIKEIQTLISEGQELDRLSHLSLFAENEKIRQRAQSNLDLMLQRYERGVCDSQIILPPYVEPLVEIKELKMICCDESFLLGEDSKLFKKLSSNQKKIVKNSNQVPNLPEYFNITGIPNKIVRRIRNQAKRCKSKDTVLTLKGYMEMLLRNIESQPIYRVRANSSQLNVQRDFLNTCFRLGKSTIYPNRNSEFVCIIQFDIQDQIDLRIFSDSKKGTSFTLAGVTFKFRSLGHAIYLGNDRIASYNGSTQFFNFDSQLLVKCLRRSKHAVGLADRDSRRENCIVTLTSEPIRPNDQNSLNR